MMTVDAEAIYRDHVAGLERRLSTDRALSQAVGGEFVAVGKLEHYLLRSLGLQDGHRVVDVGCGSGRLACQLAPFPKIGYVGCDVVPRLLAYARDLCRRPDWTFVHNDGISIPCDDESMDFACFFSVFTHLVHEDTFRYILEAVRVLKPGGLLVMSFLEFQVPSHWNEFRASVSNARPDRHLNQFLSRDAIAAWAMHAGLDVQAIHPGDSHYIPLPADVVYENGRRISGAGSLGQSVAVLRKPVAGPTGHRRADPQTGQEYNFIDSPQEDEIINPRSFLVQGWIWLGKSQSAVTSVEAWSSGRRVGETPTLFPRDDVTIALGLPQETATAFNVFCRDDVAASGQTISIQLRVRFRNGEVRVLGSERRVATVQEIPGLPDAGAAARS
jgi:SAM-dependent methyltransferase